METVNKNERGRWDTVKSSNMHIAPSPSRKRGENGNDEKGRFLRVNVKNLPVDGRYQTTDSEGVPNSRQGN